MDGPNELEEPDNGDIPCIYLRGMHWHVGDPNGPLSGQADVSRA